MKLLMAANWKMFKNRQEAAATIEALIPLLDGMPDDREAVVFAPFTALASCAATLTGHDGVNINLGGQNCYPAEEGAFTGEISPYMLKDCGCRYVLTGHSERRSLLGESDAFVGKKTAFALQSELKVMLCIGESLEERDSGKLEEVLVRQLTAGLQGVPDNVSPENLSIAYEPVWAIGTGRVAGPEEIVQSHAVVRNFLTTRFPKQGKSLRILYGGSVKPENTPEILQIDNVNGVLVGGASLKADSFSRIVRAS